MKTKIIIAISMLITTFASGQNRDLQEIKVTAPQFRSDLFQNLNDFLLSGIEYPVESKKAGDEGTVVIQFVVTSNGNITEIMVINSVSEIIDEEVIRSLEITNGMWNPGNVNGEPVAMKKEISVVFKISEKSDFVAKAKHYLESGNKLLFVQKRPEKALKYFDKSITLLPNEETLLAVRGLCKYEIGDFAGAKLDWEKLSNMNNIMTYLQFSPLYPLKGRISANIRLSRLATITPLRGQGVSKYDNKSLQ